MKTKQQVSIKKFLSRTSRMLLRAMIAVIFIAVVGSIPLFAQTEFLSENQKQKVYYDSLLNVLGADSMQGTGYTQYKRWYRYWAPKLSTNYDFDDYQSDLLDYTNNYVAPLSNNTGPNWRFIGPDDIPSLGSTGSGTGQIHYIYRRPEDEESGDILYACSPVGGLFKSTNNGESWFNLGTDKGLPHSGVSSVVGDNFSYSTLYVTTGNGEGFDGEKAWQTAIGVWRTTNDGESWENIGLQIDADTNKIYHMRKIIDVNGDQGNNAHLIVTTTEGLFSTTNANAQNPEWEELIDGEFYDVVQYGDTIYASGSNSTGIFKYDLENNIATKIFDIDTVSFPYDTITRPELRRISLQIPKAAGASNYLFAVLSMRDYNHTSIYRYNITNGNWHKFLGAPFANGYARKLGWIIRPGLHGSTSDKLHIMGRDISYLDLFYNGLSNDDSVKSRKVDITHYAKDPHDDFHYLMMDSFNDSVIWAGTDGGVYKGVFVNDSLIDWEPKSKGLGVTTIEFLDAKDNIITSGQFDCGSNVYTTSDEINWDIQHRVGGDGFQNIIDNANLYYLSAQEGRVTAFIEGSSDQMFMEKYFPWDTNCVQQDSLVWRSIFSTYYTKLGNRLYAAGEKEVLRYPDANGKWEEWSNLKDLIGCAISGTWRVDAALASDGVTHQIYASAFNEPDTVQHLFKSIDGGGAYGTKWVRVEDTPYSGWISAIEITGNADIVLVAIKDKIFSVNTSNPASPTWQDLTYDLDAGVINSIFRDGTTFWIGAEYGVYYLEGSSTSWVDYSSETLLPNCEVKDIKVHKGKVYAGTYGRGVWFASTPGCGHPDLYDTISQGDQVVIGQEKTKNLNLVIPSGVTYYVYGILKMGDSCRIIVEPGGTLVVDGGTITKACPDFWQGIELRGNSNAAQVPTAQGWVVLKNGATIEYAVAGIQTIKNHNGISDLTFAGGIIEAENSLFKNNKADVVFFPYPDPYATFAIKNNVSYFKNTGFVTDSNYYFFSDDAVNHVSLNDVYGVLFEGNLFTNTTESSMVYSDKRGIGISAWNSGFFAKRNPDSLYGNVFEKLNYGIYAFAYSNNNRLIEIDSNTFDRNQTGCYLSAETNAVLTHNFFYSRPLGTAAQAFDLPYTGLYLDHCTGYLITDNEFRSGYSPMTGSPIYTGIGAYIYNSGPEDNFIYDNYFRNLSHATIAYGRNRDKGEDVSGLQYKCNNFENNFYDIVVIGDTINPSSFDGIAPHQGSAADTVTAPAGNRFSKLGKSTYCDFNNQAPNITYHLPYWEVVLGNHKLRPDSITYNTIARDYASFPFYWDITTGCPSNQASQSKSGLKSDIATSDSNLEIYTDSLDMLVDDGNTSAMNLDVTTSLPPETMELRDELLAASPYLSDTVMVNAAEKEDVLPNSIITEVLSANPHSAKSEKVLNKLDERDTPPNENQMAEIHANDTIIGHKESLESKRSFYVGEKARTVYELSRLFIRDTLGLAVHDSIASALTNISTPTSHYLQAFCYLNTSDSLTVLNLLNNIPSAFDLDDTETDYHDYFMDYFDMLLELQTQEINAIEIDDTQKTDVADIMNNSKGLLHAYARNLLMLTDGFEYNEPYVLPDTSYTKSTKVKENIYLHFWDEESYFKLYPNPANGYITFEYKLDYNISKPVVEVLSVDGVHVNTFRLFNRIGIKIIDLRDWKSGTYIIRLTANGKMLQSDKFVKF